MAAVTPQKRQCGFENMQPAGSLVEAATTPSRQTLCAMKKTSLYLLIILLFCISNSCDRDPKYSVIPEIIDYLGFEQFIDPLTSFPKGKLTIRFTDGDGDVGLNENDTLPPFDRGSEYYYNFFVDYYEKQNGEFILLEPLEPLNSRIPRLSHSEPESIEVDLSIDLDINPFSSFDTIMLKFYIVDRTFNRSNIYTSPEIILNK